MTWRILGSLVFLGVSVMTGCSLIGIGGSESKTPPELVQSAIDGLNMNRSLSDVQTDLQHAIDQIPKEGGNKDVRDKLTEVKKKLTENSDDAAKRQAIRELEPLVQRLQSPPTTEAPSERPWGRWLTLALYCVAGIIVAFVLVVAVRYVWHRAWRNIEIKVARLVTGQMGLERKAQPDFTDKLTSLSSSQKEINSTLLDLQTEVRTLARVMRESLADRNDRRPTALPTTYPIQSDGSALKDEPEFPVSVNEYLGKMSRYANAVKLDFQNGILVNDLEKKDELFLIRVSREPDDGKPLFLVPGAAQFHNKQDFEIYYSKYYNCHRPQMGDVWIIGPAVVEKVPGGWQLREKGMLEVR
jgi:hypothetical protein